MAVTSDIPAQGTLTGATTVDTLATGSGNATSVTATFYNRSVSSVTVTFYVNGTANTNAVGTAAIDANGGYCVVNQELGSGDTFRAEASAATAITYTVATTVLS